jgi:hypothetical protein
MITFQVREELLTRARPKVFSETLREVFPPDHVPAISATLAEIMVNCSMHLRTPSGCSIPPTYLCPALLWRFGAVSGVSSSVHKCTQF